jgi:hypothetical protein
LWQTTLRESLDILVANDHLTMHSVSSISPLDPSEQAFRDVLVIAFTKVEE